MCGEGGVVLPSLLRERDEGAERGVSGSSANNEHLCLISVIGVERPDINRSTAERERETGWDLVWGLRSDNDENSKLLRYCCATGTPLAHVAQDCFVYLVWNNKNERPSHKPTPVFFLPVNNCVEPHHKVVL